MKKLIEKSLIGLLMVMVIAVTHTPGQSEDAALTLDKYLTVPAEMGNFNGTALIAKVGKIVLRKGYGYADAERKKPNTPETQFQVASVSKMFTAFAAFKLGTEGKLKIKPSQIEAVYPQTIIQTCIVHQIRNSLAFVGY